MIGFPAGLRVYLAIEPHDMRKSFNGLSAIARQLVARGLEDGAIFAFTNKRRNRLKILYYDRTGVCVSGQAARDRDVLVAVSGFAEPVAGHRGTTTPARRHRPPQRANATLV